MRNTLMVSIVMAMVLLVACNGASGPSSGSSPEEVIKAFYKAANDGKYEDAKQYLSEQSLRTVEGPLGALLGGWKGIVDNYTRDGTLDRVGVSDVNVRGDGASCTVIKHFRGGSTERLDIDFIREAGIWKIAFSTPTL